MGEVNMNKQDFIDALEKAMPRKIYPDNWELWWKDWWEHWFDEIESFPDIIAEDFSHAVGVNRNWWIMEFTIKGEDGRKQWDKFTAQAFAWLADTEINDCIPWWEESADLEQGYIWIKLAT